MGHCNWQKDGVEGDGWDSGRTAEDRSDRTELLRKSKSHRLAMLMEEEELFIVCLITNFYMPT